ncbi:hypothetical protein CDAR_420141 [Caerostris darwini]|uniref:Uncharacterized protein n=1 Tax=Caerostris darwini TaxID=1538125 RepID=A0AAV4WYG1_9ARAC|nr:hypothetical protein CDAR_420141 [Caerostris darwini]
MSQQTCRKTLTIRGGKTTTWIWERCNYKHGENSYNGTEANHCTQFSMEKMSLAQIGTPEVHNGEGQMSLYKWKKDAHYKMGKTLTIGGGKCHYINEKIITTSTGKTLQ